MKDGKKSVLKAVKKAAEYQADMKNMGWPPNCDYILYQSKRPRKTRCEEKQ